MVHFGKTNYTFWRSYIVWMDFKHHSTLTNNEYRTWQTEEAITRIQKLSSLFIQHKTEERSFCKHSCIPLCFAGLQQRGHPIPGLLMVRRITFRLGPSWSHIPILQKHAHHNDPSYEKPSWLSAVHASWFNYLTSGIKNRTRYFPALITMH